jgi:hypothetical protein
MCWAYNLADPWGNQYELNCYEHDAVGEQLVARGIEPTRYWPPERYRSRR